MMTDLTRVLADCLDAIECTGETLDARLARYPEYRAELNELLPVAALLRSAPTVAPSLDFRINARARLIARLPAHRPVTATLIDTLRSIPQSIAAAAALRPAMRRVLIVFVAVVLTGAGVAYASADALPNDALYPIKLTLEQVRLAVAPDNQHQNELRLAFAAERLREVARLIEADRGLDAIIALDDFAREVRTAIAKAQAAPAEAERQALYGQLLEALKQYEQTLTAIDDQLPAPAATTLQQAREEIRATLREGAPGLLPTDVPVLAPTSTATPRPTPTLTRSPAPTRTHPTIVITPRSTRVPGEVPTWITPDATYIATYVPTQWGTLNPTVIATLVPTQWRTLVPTGWPTIIPTRWRTYIPTAWPTAFPTIHWPTEIPHEWPTLPIKPPKKWPTLPSWP